MGPKSKGWLVEHGEERHGDPGLSWGRSGRDPGVLWVFSGSSPGLLRVFSGSSPGWANRVDQGKSRYIRAKTGKKANDVCLGRVVEQGQQSRGEAEGRGSGAGEEAEPGVRCWGMS
jgi:hypothetical protein